MDLLKERVFSELKEAFFLMREEKMMYSNETVIGENCFFCHDQSHFMTDCKYLRPQIKSSAIGAHANYRKKHQRSQFKAKKFLLKINRNE